MCMERSKIVRFFRCTRSSLGVSPVVQYILQMTKLHGSRLSKVCWKYAVLDHDVACSNFGAPYKHYTTEFIAPAQVNPIRWLCQLTCPAQATYLFIWATLFIKQTRTHITNTPRYIYHTKCRPTLALALTLTLALCQLWGRRAWNGNRPKPSRTLKIALMSICIDRLPRLLSPVTGSPLAHWLHSLACRFAYAFI